MGNKYDIRTNPEQFAEFIEGHARYNLVDGQNGKHQMVVKVHDNPVAEHLAEIRSHAEDAGFELQGIRWEDRWLEFSARPYYLNSVAQKYEQEGDA